MVTNPVKGPSQLWPRGTSWSFADLIRSKRQVLEPLCRKSSAIDVYLFIYLFINNPWQTVVFDGTTMQFAECNPENDCPQGVQGAPVCSRTAPGSAKNTCTAHSI